LLFFAADANAASPTPYRGPLQISDRLGPNELRRTWTFPGAIPIRIWTPRASRVGSRVNATWTGGGCDLECGLPQSLDTDRASPFPPTGLGDPSDDGGEAATHRRPETRGAEGWTAFCLGKRSRRTAEAATLHRNEPTTVRRGRSHRPASANRCGLMSPGSNRFARVSAPTRGRRDRCERFANLPTSRQGSWSGNATCCESVTV
jgi:hypothetical protein